MCIISPSTKFTEKSHRFKELIQILIVKQPTIDLYLTEENKNKQL